MQFEFEMKSQTCLPWPGETTEHEEEEENGITSLLKHYKNTVSGRRLSMTWAWFM